MRDMYEKRGIGDIRNVFGGVEEHIYYSDTAQTSIIDKCIQEMNDRVDVYLSNVLEELIRRGESPKDYRVEYSNDFERGPVNVNVVKIDVSRRI